VKTFLVFEPADGGRDAAAAGRVVFLREKFHWMALLFGPLWLLAKRLWIGFLLWLVAVIALSVAAVGFGLEPQTAWPLLWLPTLIVAFEGTELLRRKLLRRGYREAGAIVAADLDEAEYRFFADWSGAPAKPERETLAPVQQPRVTQSPTAPVSPSARPNPVVGLFPEPGGRR
jgi:hypothetical protein